MICVEHYKLLVYSNKACNINVVCTHQAHDLPQRGAGVEDWRHVGGVVADHARDPAADALHHLQLLSVHTF